MITISKFNGEVSLMVDDSSRHLIHSDFEYKEYRVSERDSVYEVAEVGMLTTTVLGRFDTFISAIEWIFTDRTSSVYKD